MDHPNPHAPGATGGKCPFPHLHNGGTKPKFVANFIAARNKVMNAARFDLA